jgi:hypothetical protein
MSEYYCNTCGKHKLSEEFSVNKTRSNGLQTSCKECCNLKHRNYYQSNKDWMKKDIYDKKLIRVEENQRKVYEYLKNNSCTGENCKESDPRVLEFDHTNRLTKEHNISNMVNEGYSWDTISLEIKKCTILCSNCHAKKTHAENNSYKHKLYLEEKSKFHQTLKERVDSWNAEKTKEVAKSLVKRSKYESK